MYFIHAHFWCILYTHSKYSRPNVQLILFFYQYRNWTCAFECPANPFLGQQNHGAFRWDTVPCFSAVVPESNSPSFAVMILILFQKCTSGDMACVAWQRALLAIYRNTWQYLSFAGDTLAIYIIFSLAEFFFSCNWRTFQVANRKSSP